MHAAACVDCGKPRLLRAGVLGATQPTSVYGSPETLVDDGIREAVSVTLSWANRIARAVEGLSDARAIQAALRALAPRLDVDELATTVERAHLHAQMLGALDSQWEAENEQLVAPVTFDARPSFAGQPYAEAIRYFESKRIVQRHVFDAMSDDAKRRAFTVANAASTRMIRTAHAELARQVRQGADLRDFRERVETRMESAGWTPANPSHVETIFRTNVVGAYNTGRYREMTQPDVLALRPYWQIITVNDGPPRQRPTHRAVHNWVLRADDPFWRSAFPPWGYNCRCRVRSLSGRQVQKLGLRVRSGSEVSGLPDPGFTSGPPPAIPPAPPGGGGQQPPVPPTGPARPEPPEKPKRAPRKPKGDERPAALPPLEVKRGRPVPPDLGLGIRGPSYETPEMRRALGEHLRDVDRIVDAPSPAGQRAVRERMRELVAEDGFDSRLTEDGLSGAGTLKVKPIAGARGAMVMGTGEVRIAPSVARDARGAVRALARGVEPSARELDGLRTYLHEELHGCSRIAPGVYTGASAALEEALTEMAARRQVARIAAKTKYSSADPGVGAVGNGSYWQERFHLHDLVTQAYVRSNAVGPLTPVAEIDELVDNGIHQATRVMRGPKGKTIATPRAHFDEFADQLPGLTPQARAWLKSELPSLGR